MSLEELKEHVVKCPQNVPMTQIPVEQTSAGIVVIQVKPMYE
jgi:hypothetical protein